MIIKTYLGTTAEAMEKKQYNIWIGISLGNRYFSKEHLREYILWALEYTNESILIVIADRIHAINLEVLDKMPKLKAFRKALEKGEEKEAEVREILGRLPKESQEKITILRWKEISNTKYHDYRLEILFEEYKSNAEFKVYIQDIVMDNRKAREKTLTASQMNKLAEYVLYEIPLFLNGAKAGGLPKHGGKTYLLTLYPGLGRIDTLLVGLQEGTMFPELAKKLKITDRIAILEAYAD